MSRFSIFARYYCRQSAFSLPAGMMPYQQFLNRKKLLSHYRKHGHEFKVRSEKEYLASAQHAVQFGLMIRCWYHDKWRIGFLLACQDVTDHFQFVGTADNVITTFHVKPAEQFVCKSYPIFDALPVVHRYLPTAG